MYRSGLVPRRMAMIGLVGGPLLIVSFVFQLFGVYENGSGPSFLMALPEIVWEASLGIYAAWKGFRTSHHARLEIADVVGCVVHQLHGADPPLIGLFEALELSLEEVKAFDVHDNGRLPALVRGQRIGYREDPAYAMMGHELVDPRQPIKVHVPQEARRGGAQHGQHVLRVTTQDGTVRHIGETEHGYATCAHTTPEVGTGTSRVRCEALRTSVGMHVNRDMVAEHLLGGRKRLLGMGHVSPRGGARGRVHRSERAEDRTPPPRASREGMVTAVHENLLLPPGINSRRRNTAIILHMGESIGASARPGNRGSIIWRAHGTGLLRSGQRRSGSAGRTSSDAQGCVPEVPALQCLYPPVWPARAT